MKNSTKMIDSFSQLTSDLRKRLDEEGIPWINDSDIFNPRDGITSVFERTVLMYNGKSKYDAYYGWSENETGLIIPYSYGFPNKLEIWDYESNEDPEPMSIDEIVELYKEIRESDTDEHRL